MTTLAPPAELTDRQRAILAYICDAICRDGYQPSIRDICRRFGVANNAVSGHMKALARKGYIDPSDGEGRAVRILRRPDGRPFKGLAFVE